MRGLVRVSGVDGPRLSGDNEETLTSAKTCVVFVCPVSHVICCYRLQAQASELLR